MRRPFVPALVVGLALLASACSASPRSVPSPSEAASGAFAPVDRVTVGGIHEHLDALQRIADENGGTRAVGTPGYEASVAYVVDVLRGAGYDVVTQPSEIPVFTQQAPTVLERTDPDAAAWTDGVDLRAMLYSPSGDVRAPVTRIAGTGCGAGDFAGFPDGDVALIEPGPCLRRDQVVNAQSAGASAVIASYPSATTGRPIRPTLLYPYGIDVPAVAVTREVGEALGSGADEHPQVHVVVRASVATREAESVIAQTSSGDPARVIMLGAHLDSVMDGPGINDNGSGVATLLEVARWLAGRDVVPTVRFAFWAGEEEGEYGSRDFVGALTHDERQAIEAYLNFDMVASPNFVRFVYADRPSDPAAAEMSRRIHRSFTGYFDAHGLAVEPIDLQGASDHAPFAEEGIPVGGLYSGSLETKEPEQVDAYGGQAGQPLDACFHQACDDIGNVNDEVLRQFAGALVSVVAELASVA
jgi:Zn-dependent M28 family amino/carboxypeptidase